MPLPKRKKLSPEATVQAVGSIAEAMTLTHFENAPAVVRLAFLMGYLCGGLAGAATMKQGKDKYLDWTIARGTEAEALMLSFDDVLLSEHLVNLRAYQEKLNAAKN